MALEQVEQLSQEHVDREDLVLVLEVLTKLGKRRERTGSQSSPVIRRYALRAVLSDSRHVVRQTGVVVGEPFQMIVSGPATLRLVGELDLATEHLVGSAMRSLPSGGPVTFDLSELSFIDASGLRRLSTCAATLNGRRPLTIVNASGQVLRLFRLVGLDKDPGVTIR